MKRSAITATVVLLCLWLLRGRFPATSAADADTTAWGATDPTWSPDGTRLAFSLFGSIWEAPAGGGEAKQISTSAGYHAHPRWSPLGDTIVFVSGRPPQGPIPNIYGTLKLVDVATGAERDLATPNPTAGTPAWSPNGESVVCGLQVPSAGSLLHEIPVSGGRPRQLQYAPQRSAVGSWIETTWEPRTGRIFFVASRSGTQQIWSMPADDRRVMVQMPVTRYRPDQIVLLHGLAALPDGAGVVYSADEVNGKGDYELYRIGASGGKPAAITSTERDEFAPAVSPDGKRIAYISNARGNIDLFTMPAAGGAGQHVLLSGLKFRQTAGQVHVRVLDEMGETTPVRLYVRAADGKAYGPAGVPLYHYPLEPGPDREGFFISRGDDTFPAPAGRLRLVALKGVEYEIEERQVDVPAGETAQVVIQMRRWTNWAQRGWQTGENHYHANYNGSYYLRRPETLLWMKAEDLNAANLIVANSEGAFIHDKEFFRGGVDPLSTARYTLYWGQEYRNSFPLGHMAFLNIKRQVPPSFTSVPGSSSSYDFPLNTMAALAARQQGGVVSYVHPVTQSRDVFDSSLGAKEMPVGTALGAVDVIDVLPAGENAYEMWYRFLNCGFHTVPGAGTDVFTNWRGINNIPGGSRQYVEVGSAMSWDRWIERLRQGRNFVTNGPLLTFQVNGQPMGSVIAANAGQPLRARLVAEVTSRAPFTTVEFIQNGNVIASKTFEPRTGSFRMEEEATVERSCWFAARVRGRPARGIAGGGGAPRAHSGAIYIDVGGAPTLVKEDLELMISWVDRLWALLEERDNFGPGDNRERARKMIDQARQHYQAKLAKAH